MRNVYGVSISVRRPASELMEILISEKIGDLFVNLYFYWFDYFFACLQVHVQLLNTVGTFL